MMTAVASVGKIIMVGIGDMSVCREKGSFIKTLALGSCVAIVMHDPATCCSGMAHVALPESAVAVERARQKPGHFADTAVPALVQAMLAAGANPMPKKWVIKMAGGANVMDPNNTFCIGKRNALALRKALWLLGLGPRAEDVGGNFSRTVALEVETGRLRISSPGRNDWEL